MLNVLPGLVFGAVFFGAVSLDLDCRIDELGFVLLLLLGLDARHDLFDDLFHPDQRFKVF
jgi:hypothetical protein